MCFWFTWCLTLRMHPVRKQSHFTHCSSAWNDFVYVRRSLAVRVSKCGPVLVAATCGPADTVETYGVYACLAETTQRGPARDERGLRKPVCIAAIMIPSGRISHGRCFTELGPWGALLEWCVCSGPLYTYTFSLTSASRCSGSNPKGHKCGKGADMSTAAWATDAQWCMQ